MRQFHITINAEYEAKDEEEALAIAQALAEAVRKSGFNVKVETDDFEEL
jgi:hypothetical protein